MPGKLSKFSIDVAFRIFGAHRCLSASHLKRMRLTGLERPEILKVAAGIRSLKSWQTVWTAFAENEMQVAASLTTQEPGESYQRASSAFYMAGLFLETLDPLNLALEDSSRRAFQAHGATLGNRFEALRLDLCGFKVHAYFQHLRREPKVPAIILIPPLGSSKEHIDFVSAPFLDAGFACLTVDLPGVGESEGAMPLDSQRILKEVITYLQGRADVDGDRIAMGGLSLGAYWAMKTAAEDTRVRLVIGISTPAISGHHWNHIPKHYWSYFQRAFNTPDLAVTRAVAEQLSLFGVMNRITCPVYLVHGGRDRVSQPDALELFHRETTHAPLDVVVHQDSGHCCLDRLKDDVLPTAVRWMQARI